MSESFADAEAALLMHGVQNMHENKGFLRLPAQPASARSADFALRAGISLPFPFRPGIVFRSALTSQQISELPELGDCLHQPLALKCGE
jgi:hypothetical protein